MTEIHLDFMTELQVLRILMQEYGYPLNQGVDAVEQDLKAIWPTIPRGHITTFRNLAGLVVNFYERRTGRRRQ